MPIISREQVVGVINVQHRAPHIHTGAEMEMLRTVGEQVGCVIVLARLGEEAEWKSSRVQFLLSSPRSSDKR